MSDTDLAEEFQRVFDATPPAIEPFYAHAHNSEPLVLYKGELEVVTPTRWAGRRFRGSIALHWLPAPRVGAHFVIPNATVPDIYRAFDERGVTVRPVAARPSPQRPRYDLTLRVAQVLQTLPTGEPLRAPRASGYPCRTACAVA
jgi:hypothetical protein